MLYCRWRGPWEKNRNDLSTSVLTTPEEISRKNVHYHIDIISEKLWTHERLECSTVTLATMRSVVQAKRCNISLLTSIHSPFETSINSSANVSPVLSNGVLHVHEQPNLIWSMELNAEIFSKWSFVPAIFYVGAFLCWASQKIDISICFAERMPNSLLTAHIPERKNAFWPFQTFRSWYLEPFDLILTMLSLHWKRSDGYHDFIVTRESLAIRDISGSDQSENLWQWWQWPHNPFWFVVIRIFWVNRLARTHGQTLFYFPIERNEAHWQRLLPDYEIEVGLWKSTRRGELDSALPCLWWLWFSGSKEWNHGTQCSFAFW